MFQRELRDMSFVPRWTIVRTIKGQNVAEHSYYVAVYAMQIGDHLGLDEESMCLLLRAALLHDVEETFTGDIPGPVKRQMGDMSVFNKWRDNMLVRRFGPHALAAVDAQLKSIIKLANLVDEIAFLCTEIALGNRSVPTMAMENCRRRVDATMIAMYQWFDDDKLLELRRKISELETGHVQAMTINVPTDM
jgi:5'-deoxynucleotidase YfbR-like HD superfamily hydrolase